MSYCLYTMKSGPKKGLYCGKQVINNIDNKLLCKTHNNIVKKQIERQQEKEDRLMAFEHKLMLSNKIMNGEIDDKDLTVNQIVARDLTNICINQ